MDWIYDPQNWITLFMLSALEIVLGVDNLVFISILTDKLPRKKKILARRIGLALALITRLMLLASLVWIMRLTQPIFNIMDNEISWRDLLLILGGIFLLYKSTIEIHKNIEMKEERLPHPIVNSFFFIVIQIMVIDIVFSLDSIITAVGLSRVLPVMAIAVILAVIVMMVAINPICDFIERHITIKILALSFLLLVGVSLIADGFDVHIPRGYIYFAMAFSIFVESLNFAHRKKQTKRLPPHDNPH